MVQCTENRIYVFPEKELCGLSPNSYIHVSVNDLHIPRIGPHISLQQNCKIADRSWKHINLSQIYECRNWETEHYNYVLETWEYINGNQTFILDSNQPFICSVFHMHIIQPFLMVISPSNLVLVSIKHKNLYWTYITVPRK
jgi:hypothetical protein